MLELILPHSYETFFKLINRLLDFILRQMCQNPELHCDRSEDQLTIEVVVALRATGLEANHDTKIGGHVDIVVRGKHDYHWLAEAKIGTNTGWVREGFMQLCTRYA